MFQVAVGHSIDPDSQEAIAEVLEQCQDSLAGNTPQVGILCAAIDFDHSLILTVISERFPEIALVGCTSDGELSSQMGFQQDSLTLLLFCSDEVEIQAVVGRDLSQAPAQKAQELVRQAKSQMTHPPRLCLAFPDGLRTNASDIVDGLQAELETIPLLGGVAAGGPNTTQTYQFYGTEVLQDALPLLILGGNLKLSHSFVSGWKPIGRRGRVTQVEGNVLYSIDERPALEFYKHYFDDDRPDAAYPLAVFAPGEENFFLRGATAFDTAQGSLTVGGNVPVGSMVQMTEAARDDIVQAAKASLEQAWSCYPGTEPAAALLFSCAWRRWVLGTQTGKEYEAIMDAPAQQHFPVFGFYTFGEIAPLREHGRAIAHNTTFVTLLLGTH